MVRKQTTTPPSRPLLLGRRHDILTWHAALSQAPTRSTSTPGPSGTRPPRR